MKRKKSRAFASCENSLMHEMNPYKRAKPDFSKLSDKYPALKKCMRSDDSGAQIVDWSNPLSSRLLSQALMAEDFALDVEFEADRLCPPLPNRINYLCWLAEIFQSCGIAPEVAVMDVGVGASCVYPLLGHKMFGWRFIGSDIDPDSILKASRNISKNNLQHFITTVLVPNSEGIQRYLLETGQSSISDPLKTANTFLSDDPIDSTLTTTNDADDCEGFVPDGKRPPDRSTTAVRALFASGAAYTAEHRGPLRQAIAAMGGESLAALLQLERQWADSVGKIDAAVPESVEVWLTGCMTNPPFYSFDEDIAIRPSCTGRNTELCALGGEVCFLLAIYADSKILRHRVTWYSCMTGKKSTARLLLKHLNSEGIENVRSTRFFQGSTTRWGIAWSYTTAGLNLISDKDKVFSKSLKRPKRDGCIPSSLGSASSSASSAKVTEKEFLSTMLQAEKTVCSIAESCAPDAFLEMATVRAFHSLVQAYLGNTTDGPVPLNSADKSAASHSRAGVYPPFRLLSATFIAVSCGRCQDVISTATLSDSDAPSSLSVSCSRCGLDKQGRHYVVTFLSSPTPAGGTAEACIEPTVLFMLGMQLSLTEVLCGADVRSTAITTRYSRTVDLNWLDLSAHEKMVSISVPVYRKMFTLLKEKVSSNFVRNNRHWRRLLASYDPSHLHESTPESA